MLLHRDDLLKYVIDDTRLHEMITRMVATHRTLYKFILKRGQEPLAPALFSSYDGKIISIPCFSASANLGSHGSQIPIGSPGTGLIVRR